MTTESLQKVDAHTGTPIVVIPLGGEAYEIGIRGHRVLVDQPATAGGADSAPTPTELFVASLGACVAYYAGRYLTRHGLSREGLAVFAEFEMATDRPARVGVMRVRIRLPEAFPEERRDALHAVVSSCTVHKTIVGEPDVVIDLE